MFEYSVLLFIIGLHLFFSTAGAGMVFDLAPLTAAQTEQLQQLPPEFHLIKLDILPDIPLEDAELRALFSLPEGMTISRDRVEQALHRLAKKHKFKRVSLEHITVPAGLQLTVRLESMWTLARLYLQGSMIGKERYRHFYAIGPGEYFDANKHALSIESIRQEMATLGYCNAEVSDTLSYDESTKTVTVTLHLQHHHHFTIHEVKVSVQAAEGVHVHEMDMLKKTVTKLLHSLLKKSSYSKAALDHSAKKLHEYLISLGYVSTEIELEECFDTSKSRVAVAFTVTIKQKNLFVFSGNRYFTTKQLMEQIQLFGKSVTLLPPSLIAEECTELYHQEGFWEARITWEDDGERTFFFVQEGKRCSVSEVRLEGVNAFDTAVLVKNYFKKLVSSRYVRDEMVKQALEDLGNWYVAHGFWDFSVVSSEYIPQGAARYVLIVKVAEGKQRFLKEVTLSDELVCSAPTSLAPYGVLAQPIPFAIGIIQEQKQALTKALHKQGRLYARPYPELIEEVDGTRLVWKCSGTTEAVTFGDTIVTGNSALPAHLMTRELLYKKGDVWDQKKIERSVARLKQLGIFDSVTLAPEDVATHDLSKTLLLNYVEDFPYEVRARVGVQGVNRNIVQFNAQGISYKAGGSFLVKNPLQKADCFRFDLDFSRYMYTIVANYKFPWLFNQPIRTELKVYSSHYDQPFVIGSPQVLYKAFQDGFLCSFSKDYAPFDAAVNVGCEWLEIQPGDGCGGSAASLARAIFLNQRLIGKKYPYVFMEPSIFYSSLDNKIQPTRGCLSLLSCKAMLTPTFSRAAFFKLMFEQSFYVPWGPLVFAWRGRCGTIINADFSDINPIERFYLGGAYSVRSYEPDLAPPLNPFKDAQGCLHLVPTGGRTMANMNTELRFPLYQAMSGVVFNDIGVLSDKNIRAAVKEHALVGAVGFGIRYNTVVGPLRFDIGWKLHRNPGEKSYAWFLALGNAF